MVPRIHVCPLSKVPETVRATGARSLVTLINEGTPVRRPAGIAAEKHLVVALSDIVVDVEGHTLPSESHVENLLAFVRRWDQADAFVDPLLGGRQPLDGGGLYRGVRLAPVSRRGRDRPGRSGPIRRPRHPMPGLLPSPTRCWGATGGWSPPSKKSGGATICFEGTPFALELH